jgi:hypothetical protein
LAVELEEQFSVEKKITFKYKCNQKTTCSKIKLGLLNRKTVYNKIKLGLLNRKTVYNKPVSSQCQCNDQYVNKDT